MSTCVFAHNAIFAVFRQKKTRLLRKGILSFLRYVSNAVTDVFQLISFRMSVQSER